MEIKVITLSRANEEAQAALAALYADGWRLVQVLAGYRLTAYLERETNSS